MPVIVPLAAAAIGGVASVAASKNASKAATQSAAASQQATDFATAESGRQFDISSAEAKRQFDLGQANQQPWLDTGKAALATIGQQYGLSAPSAGAPAAQGFTASPDYQFRQDEQMRALTARNAALGIQDSGAAQKSALAQSGNLASAEYGNWYNRLASLAGVGQTAANASANAGANYASQVGNLGTNYANSVGNLATNNAANLASSYQNKATAQQGMYGSLAGIGNGLLGNIYPTSNSGSAYYSGPSAQQNYGLRGLS